MTLSRRSLLVGLLAAPAIVKCASLMQLQGVPLYRGNSLLTMDMITREAVKLFKNSNAFLEQYDEAFAIVKIGDTLRIRLHSEYIANDGHYLHVQNLTDKVAYINPYQYIKEHRTLVPTEQQLPVAAALPLAAAAIIAKNPVVSRRFWGK